MTTTKKNSTKKTLIKSITKKTSSKKTSFTKKNIAILATLLGGTVTILAGIAYKYRKYKQKAYKKYLADLEDQIQKNPNIIFD